MSGLQILLGIVSIVSLVSLSAVILVSLILLRKRQRSGGPSMFDEMSVFHPYGAQYKITVLLANHEEQVHTYDVDLASGDQADTIATDLAQRVSEVARSQGPLILQYPSTTYSARHVIGVRFEVSGPRELQDALEKAQRQAGFHLPTTFN